LDALYLIDNNSSDGTPETLKKSGYIAGVLGGTILPVETQKTLDIAGCRINIHYVRMHKNTGGAGGFREALRRAREKYDYLWLMDDDVRAGKECLKSLIDSARDNRDRFIAFQCLRRAIDGKLIRWYPRFSRGLLKSFNSCRNRSNTCCFEGLFINRALVMEIGLPDERFFIVGDDLEYGLRISRVTRIRYSDDAVMEKLLPVMDRHTIVSKYYYIRNLFLIKKNHVLPFFCFCLPARVIYSLTKIAFLEQDRLKKIAVLIRAVSDGVHGRFGEANL
jgi:GT2 family glycosyltransferase